MSRKGDGDGHLREARQSRTISELKAENKILKRKIARLEKRLMRISDDFTEESPVEQSPEVIQQKKHGKQCPECDGTDFLEFDTPTRVIVFCKTCKTRF